LAFDGAEEALTLKGEGAGVVVGLTVDQQDGSLDLVGKGERGHL
jgi:hypothetical protein